MSFLSGVRIVVLAAVTFGFATLPAATQPVDTVSVGLVNIISDAPLLVAEKKGYFRDAGIEVKFVNFASGAAMVAPLGTGQLDVGGGAPSAGLYNAIARGISMKIVADKSTDSPGYGYSPVVIRKELVTSGRYKKLSDVKGMTFAEPAVGSTTAAIVERFLHKAGLKYNDVKHVFLGFPNQVAAMRNGSIDATIATEPWATVDEREGVGVRIMPNTVFYPYQQAAVIMYSNDFSSKRSSVATRFMRAYLRGATYYHDALKGGHIAGQNRDEVIGILSVGLKVDVPTLRAIIACDVNPKGYVNVKSLKEDYETYKRLGLITGEVNIDKLVDMSFVKAASRPAESQ